MPLDTGQILNKRYRVVKLLGQGGFGAVYRAWDINLNNPIALKENLATSEASARQFATEARLLANLRHTGLPFVIDHFSVEGVGQYLVMEYVEGQDLQDKLDETEGGLREAQALSWIEQVCNALTYMHTQSPPIIHRDIKPANIKITPQGKVKLVDFGIAKQYLASQQTTIGARAVTVGYSPPEQYGSGITDARSDVYALGATCYTLLTGVVPPESLQLRLGEKLLPPRAIDPNISEKTEKAVLRAMALEPEKRYQTVQAFKSALLDPAPAQVAARANASAVMPLMQPARTPTPVDITGTMVAPRPAPEPIRPPVEPAAPKHLTDRKDRRKWTGMVVGGFLGLCLLLAAAAYGYYTLGLTTDAQATDTQFSIFLAQTATELALKLAPTSTDAIPSPSAVPATEIPPTVSEPTATSSVNMPPSQTNTSSPTVVPSSTPTITPTATPKYETWTPCPGGFPSRLHVGERAFVSSDPPLKNRVRSEPDPSADNIIGMLDVGERMEILNGPECASNWVWWYVRSLETGLTGWTAEGDFEAYWLIPLR